MGGNDVKKPKLEVSGCEDLHDRPLPRGACDRFRASVRYSAASKLARKRRKMLLKPVNMSELAGLRVTEDVVSTVLIVSIPLISDPMRAVPRNQATFRDERSSQQSQASRGEGAYAQRR